MYPILVKTAAAITGASALGLIAVELYCSKKQKQINTLIANGERQMAADCLARAGWTNIEIHDAL